MRHSRVLILGNEFDPNVVLMSEMVRHLGGDIFVLRPGLDRGESMTSCCDGDSTRTSVRRTRGNYMHDFDIGDVSAVWCRGFDNNLGAWPGTIDNFVLYEWRYYWKYLENLLTDSHWINRISAIDKANDRLYQLDVARQCGLTIPETVVTTRRSAVEEFLERRSGVAIKHLSSGATSESSDRFLLAHSLNELPSDISADLPCPTLLQERIDKRVELRINVVGNSAYAGALMFSNQDTTSVTIDAKGHMMAGDFSYARYNLEKEVEQRVVELVRRLGLSFAAVDLAIDMRGRAVFFELNPSGQWYGFQTETGYPIAERIAQELLVH